MWGVRDVARAVQFWSEVLGLRPREPPSDDWAVLVPIAGAGPQLAIKLAVSDAETHQRHHLDLYCSDARSEVDRLMSLGAQPVNWDYPAGADYVVLADPDGNRFCVVEKDG